jgi:DNA-directed RNA polymerase subunit RPC12/RpoP
MLADIDGLRIHEAQLHGTEKPFGCDLCHRKFAVAKLLRNHRKSHTRVKDLMPCPHCEKEYKGPIRLRVHIQMTHESNPPKQYRSYLCEFCSKTYKNSDALKTHQQKDHLNMKTRVVCEVCNKELSDYRSLKKHRLSQHMKDYKFQCEKCGTKCLFKSHLEAHMKSAHSDSNDQPTVRKKRVREKKDHANALDKRINVSEKESNFRNPSVTGPIPTAGCVEGLEQQLTTQSTGSAS